MSLLSEEQKQAVARAVAEAENGTAGELVVVETTRSAEYGAYRALAAAAFAIALVHELGILFPDWPWLLLLVLQLPLGALFYFVLGRGLLLRLIVPSKILAARAEERAMRAFLETGVSETRDRSGVLIFLSAEEHRAVILADKGINDRVDATEWQKDVDELVQALRSGDAGGGLVRVIARVGGILAENFPPRTDDINELSDEVRKLE